MMDVTYEAKAWAWMVKNLPARRETLFWIVGRRNYNLDLIEPIKWHTSCHEAALRVKPPELEFAV